MIGKMRDMVTAAVVVSAADNKSPKFAGPESKSSQGAADSSSAAAKFGIQPEMADAVSAVPDSSKSSQEQQEEKQEQRGKLWMRKKSSLPGREMMMCRSCCQKQRFPIW